jgi:predicted PurR-regulated permease PerM
MIGALFCGALLGIVFGWKWFGLWGALVGWVAGPIITVLVLVALQDISSFFEVRREKSTKR